MLRTVLKTIVRFNSDPGCMILELVFDSYLRVYSQKTSFCRGYVHGAFYGLLIDFELQLNCSPTLDLFQTVRTEQFHALERVYQSALAPPKITHQSSSELQFITSSLIILAFKVCDFHPRTISLIVGS